MGYAVEADVRRNLGQYAPGWPRADGSPPTLADGTAFADHASGEIDAILSSHGLVTPVAAPASFVAKLTDLAALYAASLVAAGLFPQAAGPASTTLHMFLMSLYDKGIAGLRAGEGLPLAATKDPQAMPRSFWTTHPFDEDGNPTSAPIMTRTTVW